MVTSKMSKMILDKTSAIKPENKRGIKIRNVAQLIPKNIINIFAPGFQRNVFPGLTSRMQAAPIHAPISNVHKNV